MRAPNGWGSITKNKGKRRKPWVWRMTTGYEIRNGKMHQIQVTMGTFETRAEAERARAKASEKHINVEARNTTFEMIYNVLYESKFSQMKDQARKAYETAFQKCDLIKKKKMVDIDSDDMQFIIDQHKTKSVSTQNNLIILFKAVYNYALRKDIVMKDYSQFLEITSVQEKKKKMPFTREEVKKLWDMEEDWIRDSILILLYTGMRIEEMLTLKAEDVHLEERYIDLQGTKTKSAVRIIPIHKKIVPLLNKRLTSEYLFQYKKGKHVSYPTYRKNFLAVMESLGAEHTIHETRHTFVSIAGACNLNQVLVKKITGHSAGDITQDRYTHAYIEDLVKEIDKFEY